VHACLTGLRPGGTASDTEETARARERFRGGGKG